MVGEGCSLTACAVLILERVENKLQSAQVQNGKQRPDRSGSARLLVSNHKILILRG